DPIRDYPKKRYNPDYLQIQENIIFGGPYVAIHPFDIPLFVQKPYLQKQSDNQDQIWQSTGSFPLLLQRDRLLLPHEWMYPPLFSSFKYKYLHISYHIA